MKHIQISILLSISLLLTVSSCGQQQAWDGGLISVQYDRLPQGEDILLSDWAGEPEFIALDICQVSMNTQQDTLFIIQDRELRPLLTMNLGETYEPNALTIGDGDYMHDPFILPDYAVVNINKTKMVQSRNTGSGVSISMEMDLQPSIILDRRTGEVSRRTIINDILTNDSTGPTFKNGYLVSNCSAEYFMEAGLVFLENGNLSSSARKRISDILENISEEDNNVIILAPLK